MEAERLKIYKRVKSTELQRWLDIPLDDYKDAELVQAFKSILKQRFNNDTAEFWDLLRQAAHSNSEDKATEAFQILQKGIANIGTTNVFDDLQNQEISKKEIFCKVNKGDFSPVMDEFRKEIQIYLQSNTDKVSLRQVL